MTQKKLLFASYHNYLDPSNGASVQLGTNPVDNGGGLRCFPEQSEPGGDVHNEILAVVTLTAPVPSGMMASIHQKCVDPDNKLGFGGDPNDTLDASGNTVPVPNDNYGNASYWPNITILGGDNFGVSLVTITSAHAGNNYKMAVHPNNGVLAKGIFANDAVTFGIWDTPTTTKVFTQSSILTVWRTLNYEYEAATWQGMPPNFNNAAIGGFITTELARACVALRAYSNNVTYAPPIGNPMSKADFDLLHDGVGSGSGRDISGNSKDFWTIRIVMASQFDLSLKFPNNPPNTFVYGGFESGTNTIDVFYETIKYYHQQAGLSMDTLGTSIQQTILHEIGHVLMTGTDADHKNDRVMKTGISAVDKLKPQYQEFLLDDIKKIQELSRANN